MAGGIGARASTRRIFGQVGIRGRWAKRRDSLVSCGRLDKSAKLLPRTAEAEQRGREGLQSDPIGENRREARGNSGNVDLGA
jgi:hypothetical protein